MARLQDDVLESLSQEQFRVLYRYDMVPGLAGVVDQAGLAALEAHPDVRGVALGVEIQAFLGETVPLIGADLWHDQGVTGEGVLVAVLDTGIDSDHPDLADDLVGEACFREAALAASGAASVCPDGTAEQQGDGAAEDDDGDGHGTHVTGIITSAGTVAPLGVAPDAEILAVKVLGADGSGRFEDLVAGMSFVMSSHAAVDGPFDTRAVNMSTGWDLFTGDGDCDGGAPLADLLNSIAASLRLMGALPIAASGNDGSQTQISAPACNTRILSVGASDDADGVVAQTNSNANLDLLAPGSFIQSTDVGGAWQILSGTSQAAPHVTGCAALLLAAGEVATVDELADRLTTSSVQISRGALSFPRLECLAEEELPEAQPPGEDPPACFWILAVVVAVLVIGVAVWLLRRR